MKKDEEPKKERAWLFVEPGDRIIFALNTSDFFRAHWLITLLKDQVKYFKFGPELASAVFTSLLCASDEAAGSNLVKIREIFNEAKGRILWDGRLCGISASIGPTVKHLADMGVAMISLHASSAGKSIKAAIDNKGKSQLLVMTELSSVDSDVGRRFRLAALEQQIKKLPSEGIDGIICSSHETQVLRQLAPDLIIITRDVRPSWVEVYNRKQVITPAEAIGFGADAVIIGKPISQPAPAFSDPTQATAAISEEIASALSARP